MGVKAPMEGMKPSGELRSDEGEDACPDSWEMADLEESMKRLMPAGCNLGAEGLSKESGGEDESTQIDEFLREAVQDPHNRMTILRLEQEVEKFVRNPKQYQLEFPPMASSYLRLAAHRVAQHYFLITSVIDSNVEGCRIIVRKSGENKFPSVRLADIPVAADGGSQSINTKFVIKQRPQAGFMSSVDSSGAASGSRNNTAKSVEERNEEYNKARARIFRHEMEQRAYDELLEVERADSRKTIKVVENSESSSSSDQTGRQRNVNSGSNKTEKDQAGKQRQKVAIFRDREKDRKDPDYDRNYDRYSQRFDPGFGLNQPPAFGMQARYTPVVNYNTEFPQLGCPPVSQMPPPAASQSSWGYQHQHQDIMRAPAPFNPPPPRMSSHSNMSTYMSQYPYPRPSMAYTYSSQLSQPESGSTQARRH